MDKLSKKKQNNIHHNPHLLTLVAEASRALFVVVIGAVAVAAAQVSVGDGALQGAPVHRGHSDGVDAVGVLQGVGGHRVELVSTAQLDVEPTLDGAVAAVGACAGYGGWGKIQ